MHKLDDPTYLLTDQYRDASNFNARLQLHAYFSTNAYGWHPWVFDQLDLPLESHILELGCGPADLWLQNLNRIPEGWRITLSDFSPGMLEEAQRNLGHSRHRFEFALIDAQAIPLADACVDAVIANHMLYHVPDRTEALSEIHRILRVGGRFYAATNGRAHMQELDGLVHRFDPSGDPFGRQSVGHFLLENGLDQIAPWFSRVTMHRYNDALIITEAEPLIAYVLSTAAKYTLVGDKLAEFVESVEQDLAAHGAIRITKDSGIFVAFRDE